MGQALGLLPERALALLERPCHVLLRWRWWLPLLCAALHLLRPAGCSAMEG